ncbi:archease [Candidatus Uhrbacteria bacterium]|nr:archease [Candidatus Uhrbacteria bacterium]
MAFSRTDEGQSSAITCEGPASRDVFVDAAHGLFDVIADGSKIRGDERQEIVVQAEDMQRLFAAWLGELIERVAQTGMVYSDFEVFSIQKGGPKQYVLTGAVYGEVGDPKRHTIRPSVTLDQNHVAFSQSDTRSSGSFKVRWSD